MGTRRTKPLRLPCDDLPRGPRPCYYDPFGDTVPRPAGTLATLGGATEPIEQLRRHCRQCYEDWLPVCQATASHMSVRLYEQLTGRYDHDAAARAWGHREYDRGTIADRREVPRKPWTIEE